MYNGAVPPVCREAARWSRNGGDTRRPASCALRWNRLRVARRSASLPSTAPPKKTPSRPDDGSPPVTAQSPPRYSAAENGPKTNYTTRKCHFHVVSCSLGGNNVSICLYALDRCCIFCSPCKGASARWRPRSCWPKCPPSAPAPPLPHLPPEKPRLKPRLSPLHIARLGRQRARTLYIDPGSPWENGLRVSTGSRGTSCWTGSSSIRCWRCVC